MKKKIIVIQDGLKNCGCACLLSIIRYYGGNVPMDMLLDLTNTTIDGTNFYEISKAANEIGLSAKGYKLTSIEKIKETKCPFICQTIINNYKHFIVVYKITNNHITIMDPAKGLIKMSITDFSKIWTSYILIFTPYKKLPFLEKNNYLNSVLKDFFKHNKLSILNLFIITIITTIMTGLYSYYFIVIIDGYQNKSNLKILTITIIFIIIVIVKTLLEYIRNYLLIRFNKKLDIKLITTTLKRIIILPYSYYKNKSTGEIITRINDLFFLKDIISKLIVTIFLDIIFALFILIMLFMIDSTMTYIVLIITIFYFLIFTTFKPKQEKIIENVQKSNARANSCLTETVLSYETIKGLAIENATSKKVTDIYQNYIDNNLKLTTIINEKNLLNDLITGIIINYLLYFGIKHVINMNMTIGSLLTYYTLIFYFLTPIRNLFDFYQELYYGKNSLKRVNSLLNYKYESLDNYSNVKINGYIKINKLNFEYQKEKPILKVITANILAGDKVMLLGSTGSGKSTLLKLLYRYYQTKRNEIYLDNMDINDYELSTIRNNITYVSQNELLYTDTIRNNIILNRDISDNDFETICSLTYVDDIVKDKLLSYDTPLEENGLNLSGGERQRIILARALLKPASIILIDEGLNQIDIALERKILNNIFNYYKNKTIIIISHRKNNQDLYTKIYQINNGYLASINNNSLKRRKDGTNKRRNVKN